MAVVLGTHCLSLVQYIPYFDRCVPCNQYWLFTEPTFPGDRYNRLVNDISMTRAVSGLSAGCGCLSPRAARDDAQVRFFFR